jgi:hypothetical protein
MDWLVPQWIKELKREGALAAEFSREELEFIDSKTTQKYANYLQVESVIADQPMTNEQATTEVQGMMNNRPMTPLRKVEFPKDYFDNWEYKVRFYATNEARNKAVQDVSSASLLQAIAQDPTLLTDPIKSKIFLPTLERNGVSPMVVKDIQKNAQMIQQGNPSALQGLAKQALVQEA